MQEISYPIPKFCLACKAHANAKNQSLVADSIEFKEPIFAKQFVNAKEDPSSQLYCSE